ncbi:MAG: hypothetical protein D6820_07655 [Lentisphaerae bacterium]|nr:MAG: hypothetical protein D6820_07655 [Lentisphaerota bacterium]
MADGRVFIGTPARSVCAADVNTGQLLWRFETRGQVSAAPVHADGKIFFGQHGGTGDFYCVDAGSGELLWTQNLGWVWASATPFAGRLIVPAVNGNIYCLDQADGRTLWRFYAGTGCYPAPAIEDGKVLVGSWNGYYYLLDLETGEERWRFDTRGNPDSGAALMRDGRAYIQALYGRAFYCLDAETGAEIWSFEYPDGWHCNVSPALAEGKIVLSTFYYGAVCDYPIAPCLYCLDAATGELRWQARGDGGITGHAVAGGRLYSGSSCTPWFTCRDLETGEILWRCKMGGRCEETCATIYGKHAFILVTDGRLYAFA